MPIPSWRHTREVAMPESNLAENTREAVPAALKTVEPTDDGLHGLQRLWDEMFTPLLKLCRQALGDNVAVAAAAEDPGAVEPPSPAAA
jgi:hypothetical protein